MIVIMAILSVISQIKQAQNLLDNILRGKVKSFQNASRYI